MMNIMHFYESGKSRSGTALIPFFDTLKIIFAVSTRFGNLKLEYNDGAGGNFTTVKNRDYTDGNVINTVIEHIYSSEFTGDVKVTALQGLKDIYSISFSIFQDVSKIDKLNIQDFGNFIKQFPNLYSYHFNFYAYQTDARKAVIKGDLAAVPDSVERIRIENFEVLNAMAGDAYFNFSSLGANSKLKYFLFDGTYVGGALRQSNIEFLGNIANLPQLCSFFKTVKATSNSSITYTAGKVWASSFDTLSIPLALTTTELDNLLIDMDNSITTKIGDGVIALGGYRSITSDAAVASLVAKGFTVNVVRMSKVLDLPFQNSFMDSGEMGMTMVAGGTSNQPTFALSGRKPGEYCAVFNGSQSIKTTANLPINSDTVTVSFWMKTAQVSVAIITELSVNTNSNNAFYSTINETPNKLRIADRVSGYNIGYSVASINNGSWNHIVLIIDRGQNGTSQNKIYINGSLSYSQLGAPYNADNNGNFVNNILFIGQRAGSSLGFNGSLTMLKIYNHPYTATDVTNLYNSEL